MSEHRALKGKPVSSESLFPPLTRANFASSYP